MNVKRRSGLMDAVGSGNDGDIVRNTVSKRQRDGGSSNSPRTVKNAVMVQPGAPTKVRNTVSQVGRF